MYCLGKRLLGGKLKVFVSVMTSWKTEPRETNQERGAVPGNLRPNPASH